MILWSMFLFCGFGVLSGTNPTTIIALAFGAISVASAMFLILVPIPTKPPVCNGMIAPRDSWMMPPPCNEMIPPRAPRVLA